MKKIIALLLAAVLCMTILCSCSQKSDSPVLTLIDGIKDSSELTAFGSKAPSDAAIGALQDEIAALSEDDHIVCLVMVDMDTLSGIAYQPDKVMCGQSTIKAVYIGSLLESKPEAFEEDKEDIRKAIEQSNNESYERLREKYGTEYLEKWCKEVGVEHDMIEKAYPRESVQDICRLWTKMYAYLNSEKAPEELKAYYTNSANSSAKEVLGDRMTVYSKAGWENGLPFDTPFSEDMTYPADYVDKDPYNDECAINDTGIVYTDSGAYLFAIFTDHPFNYYADYTPDNPLNDLTEALYKVQQSLTAKEGEAADAENTALFSTPRERLAQEPQDSPEWVTKLDAAKDANQLVVVAGYERSTAWISMHEKDADGNWKMLTTTPGFIGKEGLGKTKAGDGKTPVGTFKFNKAFGIADDPGCAIPYTKADDDTYWSGDNDLMYNQMVSIKDYPDLNTEDSEHILDYQYEYQYCMNISYNEDGTRGKGSAIFLHCIGDRKPRTGGCVAVPEEQMYFIMQHVDPDCVIVIDSMENLGAEF